MSEKMHEIGCGGRSCLALVCSLVFCLCLGVLSLNQARAIGPTEQSLSKPTGKILVDSGMAEQGYLAAAVHLYGTVTEQGGGPVPGVIVDARDDSGALFAQTSTDETGLYDISMPLCEHCSLQFTQWIENGDYTYHKYIPEQRTITPGGLAEVRTDVVMKPVANLLLELYDSAGSQVRYAAFSSVAQGYFFATDANSLPVASAVNAALDPYFHEHGGDFALALPALLVAPQAHVCLHLQWTVPNVGKVIIDLDDGGVGYLTPATFGYRFLNVNREAAFSAVARLDDEITSFTSQGYSFSPAVIVALSAAQSAFASGESHMTANPPATALAVADYNEALSQALLAQETLYLEKAAADIPRYRKGDLRLTLLTPDGEPLSGAEITYQQRTRDFLFSAGNLTNGWTYLPQEADLLQQMGVNSAAVNVNYGQIEPSEGVYDWTYLDMYSGLDSMLGKGFQVNGALAYWAFPSRLEDCPDWWRSLTFTQYKQVLYDHFKNLAARDGTRINPWMLNEQNTTNCLNLTWDQRLEVFQTVMDGLQAGYPGAQNLVTALAMPYGWSQLPISPGTNQLPFGIPFPIYLDLLMQHELPVDNIALEFHFFGVTVPSDGSQALPGMTLASLARLMDLYNGYGVPIWIEPFQVPSTQQPNSTWWHRPWDEATQAEFAVKFYTLAFSRQYMHDICWSDANDNNPFIVSAGLLDSNYQPKLAYYALKDLISSWTTSGSGNTDADGTLVINGYAGNYAFSITTPGGYSFQSMLHIYEQKQTQVTLLEKNPLFLPLVRH
jgi:endo-1,4-beta-xylanase